MSKETVEAFVLSWTQTSRAYFAYSNVISRDLIINEKLVPSGVDLLGKWIRVVVRDHNSVVRLINIIDDLYETRIMNGNPEIKVKAYHDGCFENKFEMFHHNYFGYICDIQNIIRDIEPNGLYTFWINRLNEPRINSRWKLSLQQRSIRPYQTLSRSRSIRLLEAIIHSHSLDGNSYYAWSKDEPKSKIVIDRSMCSSSCDLIGTWVEVEVDNSNIALKAPLVVRDVYETRVRYGTTEVRIDFEAGQPGMFYNSYFGNISDPLKIVSNVENNVWYDGWIVFYIKYGIDTRWRLSKDQVVAGPFNIISNRRPNGTKVTNDTISMSHFQDRDNSPHEFERDYNVGYSKSDYQRFSRSPSPQRSKWRDSASNYENENIYDDELSRTGSVEIQDTSLTNAQQPPKIIYDNNAFEYDERFENRIIFDDHCSEKNHDLDVLTPQNNQADFILYDSTELSATQVVTQESNSRTIIPSGSRIMKTWRTLTPDSEEYFSCLEDETEEVGNSGKRNDQEDPLFGSADEDTSSSKLNRDEKRWRSSTTDESVETKPRKSKRTEEDKELLKWRSKLAQVSRLIESLTRDDNISLQMKLLGLEEYEELMKLIKQ